MVMSFVGAMMVYVGLWAIEVPVWVGTVIVCGLLLMMFSVAKSEVKYLQKKIEKEK